MGDEISVREVAEQAVLIPGGTSGIGLACARSFAGRGWMRLNW